MSIERHMNALASHYNTGFVDIKPRTWRSLMHHTMYVSARAGHGHGAVERPAVSQRYPSDNIHAPPTALKFWQNKTLHVDSEPPQLTSSAYYHTELHTGVTEGGDHRCLTARRIRV